MMPEEVYTRVQIANTFGDAGKWIVPKIALEVPGQSHHIQDADSEENEDFSLDD